MNLTYADLCLIEGAIEQKAINCVRARDQYATTDHLAGVREMGRLAHRYTDLLSRVRLMMQEQEPTP